MWEVGANDQIFKASDYAPLLGRYRNDRRFAFPTSAGSDRSKILGMPAMPRQPSVLLMVSREPGSNIHRDRD